MSARRAAAAAGVVVVVLAAVLAGIAIGRQGQSRGSGGAGSGPGGSTGSTAARGSSVSSASTGSQASELGAAGTAPAVNEKLPPSVRPQLLAAYVGYMRATSPKDDDNLTAADVDGPVVGQTYYALVPATGTYWAVAYFQPSSAVTDQQQEVEFQDEGRSGLFEKPGGGGWRMLGHAGGSGPWPCPGQLAANLQRAWLLSTPGSCQVADSGQTVPGFTAGWTSGIPNGTYFGVMSYAEADYNGSGSVEFEPESWTSASSAPSSPDHASTYLQFQPSTTTVYSVGGSPTSSHVVSGTWDSAFSRRVIDDVHRFVGHAYYGFVITLSQQTIMSIQEIGPLTPEPARPDYSIPAGS